METVTNSFVLDHFFCKKLLQEIAYNLSGSISDLPRYQKLCSEQNLTYNSSNLAAIQDIYKLLCSTHQNEYFFKNTLFNYFFNESVLSDDLNLSPTILNEFHVASSIPDLIIIKPNETSEILEIKSQCDSLERLQSQLPDYYKVFRKVSLVTGEKLYTKAIAMTKKSNLGLYLINKKGEVIQEKEAKLCNDRLELSECFKFLRQKEYLNVLKKYFNYSYSTFNPSFKNYQECKSLFCSLDKITASLEIEEALSMRTNNNLQYLSKVPFELRSLFYFSNLTKIEKSRIIDFFNRI